MKDSYKILDGNLDEDGVNEFLIKQYEYDLFDFRYSLAIVLSRKPPPSAALWNLWRIGKRESFDNNCEIVADEIKRLERIIKSMVRSLDDHILTMENRGPLFPKEKLPGKVKWKDMSTRDREFFIRKSYKIDEMIGSRINILRGCLNIFKKAKGPPTQTRTTIAALWSLVMRDNRTLHMKNIEILLDWFWKRLEGVDYRDKLYSSSPKNSLRDKITKFVKNHRTLLEKARKDIFFHNYKKFPDKEKVCPCRIEFEADGPKFYPISSPSGELAPLRASHDSPDERKRGGGIRKWRRIATSFIVRKLDNIAVRIGQKAYKQGCLKGYREGYEEAKKEAEEEKSAIK